jgi:hypothetical protein
MVLHTADSSEFFLPPPLLQAAAWSASISLNFQKMPRRIIHIYLAVTGLVVGQVP